MQGGQEENKEKEDGVKGKEISDKEGEETKRSTPGNTGIDLGTPTYNKINNDKCNIYLTHK